MLKSDDEYVKNLEHKFYASDYTDNTKRPYMVVTYSSSAVSQVCLTPTSVTMNVNSTYYLSGSVVPSTAPQGLTWISSNTSVATVSSSGMVCASSPGTVTITARSTADTSKYATCTVTVRQNTAFIIMPGMMASEIYSLQNIVEGTSVFTPGSLLWAPDGSTILQAGDMVRALKCRTNGESEYVTFTPEGAIINKDPMQNSFNYGSMDVFRNIYQRLYDNFKDQGDIVLYQYDWRNDAYDTALKFDNYINSKGYTDITIIAHSMGGLVSSHYMALGQAQRNKITKYISVGTPYLGAPIAQKIYFDGKFYDSHGLLDFFIGFAANTAMAGSIRTIAPNIKTLYSLTPPSQHFSPYLTTYIHNSAYKSDLRI